MTEDQPELTTRLQPPVAGGHGVRPAEEDRTQRVSPEGIFPPAPDAAATQRVFGDDPGLTQRITHPAPPAVRPGAPGRPSGQFPLPGQAPVPVPMPLPGPQFGQAPPGGHGLFTQPGRPGSVPQPGRTPQPGQPQSGQPGQLGWPQPGQPVQAGQPGQPVQAGQPGPQPGQVVSGGEQLAGWGRRFAGYLIDVAPVLLVVAIGGLVLIGSVTAGVITMGAGWLGGLVWVGLNRWLTGGGTGQSLGRRVMGIRLVGAGSGVPIGAGRAFLRDLCHVVDSAACCVGFLWPLWDERKQTFADKIVRTVVVTVPEGN